MRHELLGEVLGIAGSSGSVRLEDSVPVSGPGLASVLPGEERSVATTERPLVEDSPPPDGEDEGVAGPDDGVEDLLVSPALHLPPADAQEEVPGLQPGRLGQRLRVDLTQKYSEWRIVTET